MQDSSGRDGAGQDGTLYAMACHGMPRQDTTGYDRARQGTTGHDRTRPDATGHDVTRKSHSHHLFLPAWRT